jgi:hypothetical protein
MQVLAVTSEYPPLYSPPRCRLKEWALATWWEGVAEARWQRTQQTLAQQQQQLAAATAENARLLRDNERFACLIDSGDWGRRRVEELITAGEATGLFEGRSAWPGRSGSRRQGILGVWV